MRIHGTASSFRRNALDFSDVIRYHGANLANSTTMMQPRLRVPVLTALCDNPDATAAELTECLSRTAGERVTNEGAQMPWTIDVVRGCLYSLHRKAYVSTTGQRRGRSANLLYRVTEKGQAYLVAKSPTALQEVAVMPTPDEEWQREVDSAYINLVIGELQAWSPSEDDVAINLEDARETLAQGAERGIQPTPGFLELILPETVAAYRDMLEMKQGLAEAVSLGYFEEVVPGEYRLTRRGEEQAKLMLSGGEFDPALRSSEPTA